MIFFVWINPNKAIERGRKNGSAVVFKTPSECSQIKPGVILNDHEGEGLCLGFFACNESYFNISDMRNDQF